MSVPPPPPGLDADHPLHSILSGFSEPHDDVFADDERGGEEATVDPGPPRPPSPGRPRDDNAEPAPFTPPVPTLNRLVEDPHRRSRLGLASLGADMSSSVLTGMFKLSRGKLVALAAVALAIAATVGRDSESALTSALIRSVPKVGRPAERAPRDLRRRGRARRVGSRHRPRARAAVRSTATRAVDVARPQSVLAQSAQRPRVAMPQPQSPSAPARWPGSEFTTEFTP